VRLAILLLCFVSLGTACRKKSSAIAELVKAAGPVDRQHEDKLWKGVQVGAEFYLGDAARTGDGTAQPRRRRREHPQERHRARDRERQR
jgi:hypothetical protein